MAECYAQTRAGKANFQVFGHLIGRDTGSVVLWYMNSSNEGVGDTVLLSHGQFAFSGDVRGACEGLIWTNLQNRIVDDQSVIRFILEPGIIHISKIDGVRRTTFSGSYAQNEKTKWDSIKFSLTEADDRLFKAIDSLRKLEKQAGQPVFAYRIDSAYRQIDSIRRIRTRLDIGYVAKYPQSYLSGYLLRKQCRSLPVDSVKRLYSAFADSVKNSTIGYEVLQYVYPLTDDTAFRNKNPLIGAAFTKRLAGIRSFHDVSLTDMSGKRVDFTLFKGKHVLVHVWTSWCSGCVADMPMWNSLLKQYDPNVIQFISVSLDSDANAWKKAVGKYKPGGLQLVDTNAFTSLFAIYCKVVWVGKYLLIDPEGHIVNYDAAQPGDQQWRQLLDSCIKKTN